MVTKSVLEEYRIVRNDPDGDINYGDGNWYAMTLGQFIELLVDCGRDPVAIFRVTADGVRDEDGSFTREMQVVLVPDGHVLQELSRLVWPALHKTLAALLQAKLIK